MTVSFSDPEVIERLRSRKLLNLLVTANVTFAAAVLLFWTSTGVVVEAPWSWGTSASIGRLGSWQSYLNYPYVLLWALPLGCAVGARMMLSAGNQRLASVIAMAPLMIFALTFGVYHFAPLEWR